MEVRRKLPVSVGIPLGRVLRALLVVVCCGLALDVSDSRATDVAMAVGREEQLRAGYLLNFVKFVEWPAGAGADGWNLCFVGGAGIRSAIAAAAGSKDVNSHPVVTRSLIRAESAAGCQLLYVESAAPGAGERLKAVSGSGLLTVSDAMDFMASGGVVELFSEGNRLRFNISVDNARTAGLRISSSLLQLASRVEESKR